MSQARGPSRPRFKIHYTPRTFCQPLQTGVSLAGALRHHSVSPARGELDGKGIGQNEPFPGDALALRDELQGPFGVGQVGGDGRPRRG